MPVSAEEFRETMNLLAASVTASITAVTALTGSQTNFLRAASSADSNIALSQGTPLLHSEVVEARLIDNTVTDKHRNGLPANKRDIRPEMPSDYVFDPDDDDYDPDDPRHANDYGRGDHEWNQDRVDSLLIWHRTRGRAIQAPIQTLPADGYMNPSSSPIAEQRQYKAHPLTLKGTLNEGDVRKGETTMGKFLADRRWCNEYGKAFNVKQFILHLSTTGLVGKTKRVFKTSISGSCTVLLRWWVPPHV